MTYETKRQRPYLEEIQARDYDPLVQQLLLQIESGEKERLSERVAWIGLVATLVIGLFIQARGL